MVVASFYTILISLKKKELSLQYRYIIAKYSNFKVFHDSLLAKDIVLKHLRKIWWL